MSPPGDKRVTFTLKSTPFVRDPPNAGEYYEALGRAIFLWGGFENHFNTCLMMVRNIPGGKELMPEFPISWKRKAQIWRKAFNTIDALSKWRAHALKLITDATDAAQDRHKLFHGDWGEFLATEPLTAKLVTWKHKADQILITTHHVTVGNLNDFAATADGLNTRLVPYLWNLSQLQAGWPTKRKDE